MLKRGITGLEPGLLVSKTIVLTTNITPTLMGHRPIGIEPIFQCKGWLFFKTKQLSVLQLLSTLTNPFDSCIAYTLGRIRTCEALWRKILSLNVFENCCILTSYRAPVRDSRFRSDSGVMSATRFHCAKSRYSVLPYAYRRIRTTEINRHFQTLYQQVCVLCSLPVRFRTDSRQRGHHRLTQENNGNSFDSLTQFINPRSTNWANGVITSRMNSLKHAPELK